MYNINKDYLGGKMQKIAIIDIGSNSVRLVLFEIYKNHFFRVIDDIKERKIQKKKRTRKKITKLKIKISNTSIITNKS